MSNSIDHHGNSNSSMKRSRKPKPLFGIFRKNKPDPVVVIPSTSSPITLGSGVSSVPLGSILATTTTNNNYKLNPYTQPRLPNKTINSDLRNPLLSPQFNSTASKQQQQQQQYQRRPRSKSVGRDPSSYTTNNSHMRLMEERESALNKLCQKEMNSPTSSLVESLPLLSPTYSPPPVPPIPLRHQLPRSPQQTNGSPRSPQEPTMRKFSSAHDLRKAAKLQQDSINQAQIKPLPSPTSKKDLSRSRSLSNGQQPRKLRSSKSQQHLRSPTTPNVMTLSRPRWPPTRNDRDDDDDDDIPLGFLQSPISRPSSLLSDKEEDDDKDLVPIATLNIVESTHSPTDYQTAADKYKEKVRERLQLDDDDDDIPISLLSRVKK